MKYATFFTLSERRVPVIFMAPNSMPGRKNQPESVHAHGSPVTRLFQKRRASTCGNCTPARLTEQPGKTTQTGSVNNPTGLARQQM